MKAEETEEAVRDNAINWVSSGGPSPPNPEEGETHKVAECHGSGSVRALMTFQADAAKWASTDLLTGETQGVSGVGVERDWR